MGQDIYWHAPLWEVLMAILISLALLARLVRRALRRSDLPTALSAIHPALSDQPLFYFDHIRGLTGLNHTARGLLEDLSASKETLPLDVLRDVLLEAYGEARVVQQRGWPEPHHALVAVPVFDPEDEVTGVMSVSISTSADYRAALAANADLGHVCLLMGAWPASAGQRLANSIQFRRTMAHSAKW